LDVRFRGVRILAVRSLPTGPQWQSASFGLQFTRWPVRKSLGPHFTTAHWPKLVGV